MDTFFLGIIALFSFINFFTIRHQGKEVRGTLKTLLHKFMNEEEVISDDDLKADGIITFYKEKPFSGVSTNWHKNGNIKSIIRYQNGKLHGLDTKWDKYGKKIYQATMADGLIGRFHK